MQQNYSYIVEHFDAKISVRATSVASPEMLVKSCYCLEPDTAS